MDSIYDPSSYPTGVLNPLGPREHAWNTEAHNQGQRYHGPIYDRPMASFPWGEKPLWGVGQEPRSLWDEITSDEWTKPIAIGAAGGFVVGALVGWLIGRKRKS